MDSDETNDLKQTSELTTRLAQQSIIFKKHW